MSDLQTLPFWLDPSTPDSRAGPAEAVKAALCDAYSEPHRRYHDLTHIAACLEELSALDGVSDAERLRLALAIWWHDVVYDPTRSDNEAQSANRAEQELSALGAPPEDVCEVARLIHLTVGHRTEPDDRLGALMVSIDLSILGREPAVYDAYAQAIREEYAHVPEAFFRAGRAAVLRKMLESAPLFPDLAFRERFEAAARANLAREIEALSASPA